MTAVLTPRLPVQRATLACGLAAGVGLLALLASRSLPMAALFVIGLLLGVTLYHARFGFTAAYRRLLLYGEVSAVQAQIAMLAAATLLFAPVLASGSALGREAVGAVAPVGWQVAAGAFLFGIGMQIAGGCGSGTLYTVGGGSLRMVLTLVTFCVGSFWASLDMDWWQRLPSWDPGPMGAVLGWPRTVALQLAFLAVLAWAAWHWGKAAPSAAASQGSLWQRVLAGPWPLMVGAILLAALNFLTLLVAGHPWSITWAFALWGAKAATVWGWDPASSSFWSNGFQRSALESSILDDDTSVMDIGILLGALLAAALAGRFAPSFRIAPRSAAAAVIGGLALGYGARIAYGCNIGAFFSGVASTSLHGWLWIVAALPGNWLGVRLRPLFGLHD